MPTSRTFSQAHEARFGDTARQRKREATAKDEKERIEWKKEEGRRKERSEFRYKLRYLGRLRSCNCFVASELCAIASTTENPVKLGGIGLIAFGAGPLALQHPGRLYNRLASREVSNQKSEVTYTTYRYTYR